VTLHKDFSGATNDDHLVTLWLSGRPKSTQRVYLPVAKGFLGHLPSNLKEACVSDVVAWFDTLRGEPSTQARIVATIKSLLSYAHRVGYTVFNVGRTLRCVRVPNRLHERILEEPSVIAMVKACKEGRDRTLVRLLYTSGLRISEALSLRLIDVGPNRLTVQGKGSKSRTILMPPAVCDELKALLGPDASPKARLFLNYQGAPLSDRGARNIVYAAAAEAGLTASPHWFRHAHATHAIDRGAPLHVVRDSLGHESIATTSRYLHARPTVGASQFLPAV
jgi:integrase/recombinase XerD